MISPVWRLIIDYCYLFGICFLDFRIKMRIACPCLMASSLVLFL